jgi:hydroxypyruvate isomerase
MSAPDRWITIDNANAGQRRQLRLYAGLLVWRPLVGRHPEPEVNRVGRFIRSRLSAWSYIYHLQIMEGDIARTIRENIQWLGHFHTGGNPGRHEIDNTQELNYRFIAQTIADLGFTGYFAHEYSPAPGHDPIKSLETALEICDV